MLTRSRVAMPALPTLLLVGGALLGGLFAPAAAQTRTAVDARDAANGVDVRAVRYENGSYDVRTKVRVRFLTGTGTLSVRLSLPQRPEVFLASVSRASDGTLTTALVRVDQGRAPVACDLDAAWSLDQDYVSLSVPQRCFQVGRFLARMEFQGFFAARGAVDTLTAVVLGRGDTPGCATFAEVERVRAGQPIELAHGLLETGGTLVERTESEETRRYVVCGRPDAEFTITTDLATKRITLAKYVQLGGPPPAPTRS